MFRNKCFSAAGIFLAFIPFNIFFFVTLSEADETRVTGSLALRQNFDSNVTRVSEDKTSGWRSFVSPTLSINSSSDRQSYSLRYTPSYTYDQLTDDEELHHSLAASLNAFITDKWQLNLVENYVLTDDSADDDNTAFINSTKRGRNKFGTNIATINSNYEFRKKSFLILGYKNTVLENESPAVADYDRHEANSSISLQMTQRWATFLSYSYSKGNFDEAETSEQPQDSETHMPGGGISFQATPHNLLSLNYQYVKSKFQSQDATTPDQEGYEVHNANLKWVSQATQNTSFTAFFGPSFIQRQSQDDETRYNYGADLTSNMNKSSVKISGSGGVDDRQFTGNNEDAISGLSIFWLAETNLSYNLSKNLSTRIFGSIREDTFKLLSIEREETSYKGGAAFSYSFFRWFIFSATGEYYELDTTTRIANESGFDTYNGYRLYFTFSAGREIWHW